MGILSKIGLNSSPLVPSLNTGLPMDIATGSFVGGVDGHMFLSGGIGPISGVSGKSQTYKSTAVLSAVAKILQIYPDTDALIYDTETTLKFDRVAKLAGDPSLNDRGVVINPSTCPTIDDFDEYIRTITEEKAKHKKDYMIETPFIDYRNGEPFRMMIPTICVVDSLSFATSKMQDDMYEKLALSDGKNQTTHMVDGHKKDLFIRKMNRLAVSHGLYFIFTAHLGTNMNLTNSHLPPSKEMQYMRQDAKLKNVSPSFHRLTNPLIETRKATLLQDSKKECEYPDGEGSSVNELSAIESVIIRCKGDSGSGSSFSQISSQTNGILPEVSNYHFLKENGEEVLISGTSAARRCSIYPDVVFNRKTLRAKARENYELARALELSAQLAYIQKYWTTDTRSAVNLSLPKKDFVEKINADKTLRDEILNSRGYWTYGENDRKFMSLYDIVELISK